MTAVLATGLLASACGSSDDTADDELPGVGTSEDAAPEGEQPDDEDTEGGDDAEPGDGIDRPEITLPDDIDNVFEEPATDDPDELALLTDVEHHINAVDEAVANGSTEAMGLTFYTKDQALIESLDYITGMHENNESFAGTTRYYNRTVEMLDEETAISSYCVDQSGSHTYDLETGEQAPGGDVRYLFDMRVERTEQGVWQDAEFDIESGVSTCDE